MISIILLFVGRERNTIVGVLRDVSWEELADQLGLASQSTAIETGCSTEIRAVRATCYLNAVVKRYIQSQPDEACKESVGKIVNALKGLGNRYEKEATNLIAEFKLSEFGEFANAGKKSHFKLVDFTETFPKSLHPSPPLKVNALLLPYLLLQKVSLRWIYK